MSDDVNDMVSSVTFREKRYPGVVTVWDFDGNYLGFMGENAWEASKVVGDRWKLVTEIVEALDNVISSIPPRHSHESEREAFEHEVDEASELLKKWNAST